MFTRRQWSDPQKYTTRQHVLASTGTNLEMSQGYLNLDLKTLVGAVVMPSPNLAELSGLSCESLEALSWPSVFVAEYK
jgi:hypothetical protein